MRKGVIGYNIFENGVMSTLPEIHIKMGSLGTDLQKLDTVKADTFARLIFRALPILNRFACF